MLSIYITEELQAQYFKNDKVVLLYYFCDGRDEQRNNAVSIVRGLILQLVTRRRDLAKFLIPEYRVREKNLFRPQSLETLWRIFMQMIQDLYTERVFCILDGLDECECESLEHLLKKIRMFYAERAKAKATSVKEQHSGSTSDEPSTTPLSPSNPRGPNNDEPSYLKMLLVSREKPDCLATELGGLPKLRLDLDTFDDYASSLRKFVDAKVAEISELKGHSDSTRESVTQALQKRGDGSFLWVQMAAEEMKKSSQRTTSEDIERLPNRIDDMYIQALSDIPVGERQRLVAILRWVVTAMRPLKLPELAAALSSPCCGLGYVSIHDLERSIASCTKLLAMSGDEISLVHQSTKEFLLKDDWASHPELEAIQVFQVKGVQTHAEITRVCLNLLSSGILKEPAITYKPSSSGGSHLPGTRPFLAYAIANWPEHARLTTSDCLDFSSSFFSKNSPARASWWPLYWDTSTDMNSTSLSKATVPRWFTLAHLACHLGILPLAEHLEQTGELAAMVNCTDSYGFCPTEWAVMRGDEAMTAFMLNHGATFLSRSGSTLLHEASFAGHVAVVRMMLDRGYPPDLSAEELKSKGDKKNWTFKAWHPHVALAAIMDLQQKLEDNPAGIFETSGREHRPLHLAARNGHEAVTQLLLERGASVNLTTTEGFTALHLAAFNGYHTVVLILHKYGGDIQASSKTQWSPLHGAARNNMPVTVQKLLYKGANIEARTTKQKTALHFAASKGHGSVVTILVERGADLNAQDHKGMTPVHIAVKECKGAVVQILVNAGADLQLPSKDGLTPLARARKTSQTEIISILKTGPVPQEDDKVQSAKPGQIRCDSCDKSIPDKDFHYHCSVCNGGNFDICQDCADRGLNCNNVQHDFIKRRVYEGTSRFYCNNCEQSIADEHYHYHCSTCYGGDFDLCQACIDCGVACGGGVGEHSLIKRSVKNGFLSEASTSEKLLIASASDKDSGEPQKEPGPNEATSNFASHESETSVTTRFSPDVVPMSDGPAEIPPVPIPMAKVSAVVTSSGESVTSKDYLASEQGYVRDIQSSNCSEDPLPASLRTPKIYHQVTDADRTLTKLNALSTELYTKCVPACITFTMDPPADSNARETTRRQLSEELVTQIIMETDSIETEDGSEARSRKKRLIEHAHRFLKQLDDVPVLETQPSVAAPATSHTLPIISAVAAPPSPPLLNRPRPATLPLPETGQTSPKPLPPAIPQRVNQATSVPPLPPRQASPCFPPSDSPIQSLLASSPPLVTTSPPPLPPQQELSISPPLPPRGPSPYSPGRLPPQAFPPPPVHHSRVAGGTGVRTTNFNNH